MTGEDVLKDYIEDYKIKEKAQLKKKIITTQIILGIPIVFLAGVISMVIATAIEASDKILEISILFLTIFALVLIRIAIKGKYNRENRDASFYVTKGTVLDKFIGNSDVWGRIYGSSNANNGFVRGYQEGGGSRYYATVNVNNIKRTLAVSAELYGVIEKRDNFYILEKQSAELHQDVAYAIDGSNIISYN